MGLIRTAIDTGRGILADQWKEYFYCDALPANVLAVRGQKRNSGRSSNYKGYENIITSGSVIAVADGQCMMIVDQGRIAEFTAEPGTFTYDASTEPTIFCGHFGQGVIDSFRTLGRRFTFGGEPPKDQRIYYFNTKELTGNKYGTPSPVPFRVVDRNIGLDIDIAIRCFGEYSYRISDPILFYKNVCGNVTEEFTTADIDSQLKTELLSALQPAFARISEQGIRYSAVPSHTQELSEAMHQELSSKWGSLRGLEIVSMAVASLKASEEDEAMIKQLQRNAALRDPGMAGAHLVAAQAEAMKSAAQNENGAMMGFMGMGMASAAGGANANQLFQQAQQMPPAAPVPAPAAPAADSWKCSCGATVSGNFCPECGAKKPEPAEKWVCSCGAVNTGKFCTECGVRRPEAKSRGWTCSCGTVNLGKFCTNCGARKPADAPLYRCDKCGWEPEDPHHPPKFCPECGDRFDDEDIR